MRILYAALLSMIACGDSKPAQAPIVVAEVAPAASSVSSPSPSSSPTPASSAPSEAAEATEATDGGTKPPYELGGRRTKSPSLRQGQVSINGKLPPEVIQRIVRQNFGRFRLCYENGLRTNPALGGKVTVKFTIDGTGAVSKPSDGPSDLADKNVIACIVRGFSNLSFPQPPSGVVVVAYPIIFDPGE